MWFWVRSIVFMSLLVLLSGEAFAETEYGGPWEKFRLSVGGFTSRSDTTLQVNSGALGVGTVINLEDALGVETNFRTYRVDSAYRFGETRRHEAEFHYFDATRRGGKALEKDITIGDKTFTAGTLTVTEFNLEFVNVDYVYNFLLDDRVRLGASVGIHTTKVGLRIDSSSGGVLEDESFTAPLPVIGLRGDFILTPKWRFKTDVNLFYLEYDNYVGRVSDTYVGIEYLPFKHFGIGAGVNSVSYRIEADRDSTGTDLNGMVKFQLTGFMLYGKYSF